MFTGGSVTKDGAAVRAVEFDAPRTVDQGQDSPTFQSAGKLAHHMGLFHHASLHGDASPAGGRAPRSGGLVALALFALMLGGCGRSSSDAAVETEAARLARDGRAKLAEGDKKAARAHFQRAMEVGPKEPHGRLGIALIELIEGNTPSAEDQLVALRAGGLDPAREAPWLVTLLDARRHFPAAEAVMRGGSPDVTQPAAAPDTAPSAEQNHAAPVDGDAPLIESFRRGDYEAVRRAVEPEPSPTLFRQKLLADAYYNLQDWTRAVRTYRLVLRAEPANEPVTQYLADALVRLGRYDDAIGFYRVLAENNPTRPGFWRLIGDAATAKGDTEVALASYLRAVSAGYDDANVNAAIVALKAKLAAAAGTPGITPPPAPAPAPDPSRGGPGSGAPAHALPLDAEEPPSPAPPAEPPGPREPDDAEPILPAPANPSGDEGSGERRNDKRRGDKPRDDKPRAERRRRPGDQPPAGRVDPGDAIPDIRPPPPDAPSEPPPAAPRPADPKPAEPDPPPESPAP